MQTGNQYVNILLNHTILMPKLVSQIVALSNCNLIMLIAKESSLAKFRV